QTWDDLVDFSDILPTFVELCGGRLPVGVRMDGQSFAARLSGRGTGSRDWVCAEGRGKFFVKTRDWKLYSDGRIFHTQIDSFENRPVAANAVPEPAREDLKVLREAMAVLRQRGR
ncbi:MAG: Cerebroside-sulfatase, partial [Planctomycetaceae bacterium]